MPGSSARGAETSSTTGASTGTDGATASCRAGSRGEGTSKSQPMSRRYGSTSHIDTFCPRTTAVATIIPTRQTRAATARIPSVFARGCGHAASWLGGGISRTPKGSKGSGTGPTSPPMPGEEYRIAAERSWSDSRPGGDRLEVDLPVGPLATVDRDAIEVAACGGSLRSILAISPPRSPRPGRPRRNPGSGWRGEGEGNFRGNCPLLSPDFDSTKSRFQPPDSRLSARPAPGAQPAFWLVEMRAFRRS